MKCHNVTIMAAISAPECWMLPTEYRIQCTPVRLGYNASGGKLNCSFILPLVHCVLQVPDSYYQTPEPVASSRPTSSRDGTVGFSLIFRGSRSSGYSGRVYVPGIVARTIKWAAATLLIRKRWKHVAKCQGKMRGNKAIE